MEVNGLFRARTTVRKVRECFECLVEVGGRLSIGRARNRLPSGLTEIEDGLRPCLAAERVMSQTFGVLRKPRGIATLDGLDRPGVERATAVLQEASVGHFVGEGVLEGVGRIRE